MNPNKLTPGSNLRWESSRMILPEHREKWLNHQKQQAKQKKPEMDPQRWEELEWMLGDAMRNDAVLCFTYWRDGFFHKIIGRCSYINHVQKQFHLATGDGTVYLRFEDLADIACI
ncbi:YolD-like protein [Alteribacillus persepolensis]|uniref:YolD-like protein n=1 Tax=Alteribacillus persepolensis TaxID=568899 RepID=A0A1G8G4R2_9BACI|nr:YolD-like family protein [Alteribacillus persepolensis]SDH89355.1 YolD-like protein [Alteribacillus persepolensis]